MTSKVNVANATSKEGEVSGAEVTQEVQSPISFVEKVLSKTNEFEGMLFPETCTPEVISAIMAMDIREDDIFITSYPKCGTHWMMEIVQLLLNGGQTPSSQQRVEKMGMLLELKDLGCKQLLGGKPNYEILAERSSPRLIITHLPLQFLPTQIWTKKPRIIYVSRHPRDSLASTFNFLSADPKPPPFEMLFEGFLAKTVVYGPCWAHQFGFWEHRNDENVLFLRFEDMKEDPAGNVAKVSAHLNCKLTEEQLNNAVKLSSLPEMKASYARIEEELGPEGKLLTHAGGVLPFLYKGTVGGWKALFSETQAETFQKHHEEQIEKYGVDMWSS